MKRYKVLAIVVFTVGIALSLWGSRLCAGNEITKGKALFQDKCTVCHGMDGKGNGPASGALSTTPTDFTAAGFWQSTSDQKIKDTIKNGHAPMPPFDLTDEEIKDLIEYMKHAFKQT